MLSTSETYGFVLFKVLGGDNIHTQRQSRRGPLVDLFDCPTVVKLTFRRLHQTAFKIRGESQSSHPKWSNNIANKVRFPFFGKYLTEGLLGVGRGHQWKPRSHNECASSMGTSVGVPALQITLVAPASPGACISAFISN